MKKLIFTAILIVAFGVRGQQFDVQKLDKLLTLIRDNNKGMGSLSVFENGLEIYQRSVGYADVENETPATGETRYRIGSVSKMFTATLVMQLVEEGKITLDTKLSEFYPEIPNAEQITIAQLLTHKSGIYNFGSSRNYKEWQYLPKTKEELLSIFRNNPASFDPGERSAYSNTNYVILSFIIEDILKQDYAQILESRFVRPLELKSTYYGEKIDPGKKEAFSYIRMGDWQKDQETHSSITRGAGAIVSTPQDLNIFMNALLEGRLLKQESLKLMQNFDSRFGMGMYLIPFFEDERIIGHTGGLDGFATMLVSIPDRDLSLAYSANAFNLPMDNLMKGILSIVLNKEYDLSQFSSLKLTDEELKPFTGTYRGADFPMDLKVYIEKNTLISRADGPGQEPFPLDAVEKNIFKFDRAGVMLEFLQAENKVLLKQGGKVIELKKL